MLQSDLYIQELINYTLAWDILGVCFIIILCISLFFGRKYLLKKDFDTKVDKKVATEISLLILISIYLIVLMPLINCVQDITKIYFAPKVFIVDTLRDK